MIGGVFRCWSTNERAPERPSVYEVEQRIVLADQMPMELSMCAFDIAPLISAAVLLVCGGRAPFYQRIGVKQQGFAQSSQ